MNLFLWLCQKLLINEFGIHNAGLERKLNLHTVCWQPLYNFDGGFELVVQSHLSWSLHGFLDPISRPMVYFITSTSLSVHCVS